MELKLKVELGNQLAYVVLESNQCGIETTMAMIQLSQASECLNRTNVELKPIGSMIFPGLGTALESNQCGIETSGVSRLS